MPAQAARAFEKAIALAPALIPAREELADLHGAAGRHEEEIDQLQVLAALEERLEGPDLDVLDVLEDWHHDAAADSAGAAIGWRGPGRDGCGMNDWPQKAQDSDLAQLNKTVAEKVGRGVPPSRGSPGTVRPTVRP